jgi:hypothetical protein
MTRFRALNFIEDLQRGGGVLADALRQASLHPWPDENGDYYAVRMLEDWWYAYKKGGFNALMPADGQGWPAAACRLCSATNRAEETNMPPEPHAGSRMRP